MVNFINFEKIKRAYNSRRGSACMIGVKVARLAENTLTKTTVG